MKIPYYIRNFAGLLLIILLMNGCSEEKTVVTVLHAGSLSVPFKAMEKEYEASHPGVDIRLESAGSLTCVRQITDLHKSCDLLAVADYALIDALMIPDYASFNVRFTANEMAIGYLPGNDAAAMISSDNWYKLLLNDEITYGRADPNHDPLGYRTEIVLFLAEKYYNEPGLQQQFLEKNQRFIRPKGTELLPLLETGAIDFVFQYRSVLQQHNLAMLLLPDSLNMSKESLNDWYANGCVRIPDASQGQDITKCGESLIYGVTLPNTGKNPGEARAFLTFMLTHGGQIMVENGHAPFSLSATDQSVALPGWLQRLIEDQKEK